MRKLFLPIAAAAAVVCAGSFANRVEAMTVGDPAGVRAALNDLAVTDQVHCIWGWRHHNWWRGRPHWDGCFHGRVFYGPSVFIGPRFHRHVFFRRHFVVRPHFRSAFHFHGGHWR